jgi:hypothetical protein
MNLVHMTKYEINYFHLLDEWSTGESIVLTFKNKFASLLYSYKQYSKKKLLIWFSFCWYNIQVYINILTLHADCKLWPYFICHCHPFSTKEGKEENDSINGKRNWYLKIKILIFKTQNKKTLKIGEESKSSTKGVFLHLHTKSQLTNSPKQGMDHLPSPSHHTSHQSSVEMEYFFCQFWADACRDSCTSVKKPFYIIKHN